MFSLAELLTKKTPKRQVLWQLIVLLKRGVVIGGFSFSISFSSHSHAGLRLILTGLQPGVSLPRDGLNRFNGLPVAFICKGPFKTVGKLLKRLREILRI
jgi:hypothetical protein